MFVNYILEDPLDGAIHYTGITDNVRRRYVEHIRMVDDNLEKTAWIASLLVKGYLPIMRTIEVWETSGEASTREAYWIHYYQELGHILYNRDFPQVNGQKQNDILTRKQRKAVYGDMFETPFIPPTQLDPSVPIPLYIYVERKAVSTRASRAQTGRKRNKDEADAIRRYYLMYRQWPQELNLTDDEKDYYRKSLRKRGLITYI